jgi:hypothetical protein
LKTGDLEELDFGHWRSSLQNPSHKRSFRVGEKANFENYSPQCRPFKLVFVNGKYCAPSQQRQSISSEQKETVG